MSGEVLTALLPPMRRFLPLLFSALFLVTACNGTSGTATPSDDAGAADEVDANVLDGDGAAGCKQGSECTPTDACKKGATVCADGIATCRATDPLPNGTSCGDGLACIGGACVTCQDGVSCLPANPCHAGHVSCASAARGCVDDATPLADGTACGVGQACIGGACSVVCRAGAACTIPNSCRQGLTTCATPTAPAGSETCVETSVPLKDGASCGAGNVCLAGVCLACAAGVTCVPSANPCHVGTTSCTTGAQVCEDASTAAPDGTPCGDGKVCTAGSCAPCADGTACVPSSSCHVGITKCTSGAATCVDTGAAAVPGATCAAASVCSASGTCIACLQDAACLFAGNSCHRGKLDCATGAPICKDAGTPAADGTACGPDLACSAGACVACKAGLACVPAGNTCHVGTTSCATGASVCVDSGNNAPDGLGCGAGQFCSAGACVPCSDGGACSPSANACHVGTTSCAGGKSTCIDTNAAASPGKSCGSSQVCSAAGTCVSCNQGAPCAYGTNPCHAGKIDCSSGAPACVDAATNVGDGTSCGPDLVCRAGACVACKASASCTPTSACHVGVTSCATGSATCADTGASAPDGLACGANQFCRAGACAACSDGATCTPTNVCHGGVTSCAGGAATCVDSGSALTPGRSCGTDRVCSPAGSCVACTQGAACAYGGNPCHAGTTDCSTGVALCKDAGTNVTDGTACGTNLVCKSGACASCTAGAACTPSNSCHAGTTSCATGVAVCVDAATNAPDGLSCGVNKYCYAGTCGACTDGASCTPTASACHVGTTSCAGGVATCVDTGASVAAGKSCGAGLVCSPAGSCGACAQGASCAYGGNPCHAGTTDCATGVALCKDTATNLVDGTSCGTNLVCKAGACTTCKAGLACTPGNPCHTGTTSCATGASVCIDSAANAPDGVACGSGLFCNAGVCGACAEGAACAPANACHTGTTSCATGKAVCTDSGGALAAGTSCGANQVCAPGGSCIACTAGASCTPVTNPCHAGATSCASGASVCTDTGTALTNGTACGAGAVCNAGSCTTCIAGGACTPTNTCDLGVYSCATGVKTCVDAGPDGAKTGSACGTSATGTCAAGTCACPAGRLWNGTDCAACPAPSGNELVVVPDDGVDNACCGALSAPGSVIGGVCRTATQALKNVKGSGWTVRVRSAFAAVAASDEAYPLYLRNGVHFLASVRFGGATSKDIFVADDGTTITLGEDITSSGELAIGGNPSTGTIAGRDGLVVKASPSGVATNVVLLDFGLEVAHIRFGNVARDAIHVDGGSITMRSLNYASAGNAQVWCKSETNPLVPSAVSFPEGSIVGGVVGPYGTPSVGAAKYGVFAGHGCSISSPKRSNGVETRMESWSSATAGCLLQYPVWLEDDASFVASHLWITCAGIDGISLHPSPTGGSGAPSLMLDENSYIVETKCAAIRAEAGRARIRGTRISGNRWGLYQQSAASSSDPLLALIDAAGDGTCAGGSGSGACANIVAHDGVYGAGSDTLCCPMGGPCPPFGDIVNRSGLPLLASGNGFNYCPIGTCTCNAAFASCTCTGAAAGNTTLPSFVNVLNAPYTTGTPTTTVSGAYCAP